MKPLKALFFPETVPCRNAASQLLLFFDTLLYYLPVEDISDNTTDFFAGTGLLKSHTPSPLGDDLARFRQLLRDLRGHEDEFYLGYLASLSMELHKDKDDVSVWSIISNISGAVPQNLQDEKNDAKARLWQARLLLKLAEILEQEDLAIAQELAAINARQREMLKRLRGEEELDEEDEGETFITEYNTPASPTRLPIRMEQRLWAWGQLFLTDNKTDDRPILATTLPDAAAELFETYEKFCKKAPIKILSIPLPRLKEMDEERYLAERDALYKKGFDRLSGFSQSLSGLADGTKEQADVAAKLDAGAAAWPELMRSFAESSLGENELEVYFLPGMSPHDLFRRHCRVKNGKQPDQAGKENNTIMAVLRET